MGTGVQHIHTHRDIQPVPCPPICRLEGRAYYLFKLTTANIADFERVRLAFLVGSSLLLTSGSFSVARQERDGVIAGTLPYQPLVPGSPRPPHLLDLYGVTRVGHALATL